MWNLLVVEDESIVRLGLRYMMNWEEFGVYWKAEASNGEDALRLMQADEIHIVLTDIRMPGMDGLDFAKTVRRQYPNVQIIFLSSYDNFSYAKEALRIGAVDYLHKLTMDEEEIGGALNKAVQALQTTAQVKPSLTEEERNEFLLSLLDEFTMPENPHLYGLDFGSLEAGCWLTVLRRRDDAVSGSDEDHLRFRSIQYLIAEWVTKEWGGFVLHRNYREIIWIASAAGRWGEAEAPDRDKILEGLRKKILELLGVALIYSSSSLHSGVSRLPQAYLEALLQLPQNDQSDNYIVRRAKQFIDCHLLQEVTLVKVAEEIHISAGYLSRVFLKEVGENFSDYIIRNKLEHAQKLLRETNRKIYEISSDIGYTNPQYFSKLFKDRIGVTPLEYRNQ